MGFDIVDRAVEDWHRERPDLDAARMEMEVVDRLVRVAGYLREGAEAALAPFGLSAPGYGVLAALRRAGEPYELTPTELSRQARLTSGAMTNRIDRLEEEGLVERRRHRGGDRRSVHIRLTEKGRKLLDRAATARFAQAAKALEGLGPRDVDALRRLLRKLATDFETRA